MPITLDVRFKPRGDRAELVWNLDGEDGDGLIAAPFGPDAALVLRMLDQAQHEHPDAASYYLAQADDHGRLASLGFSDGARLLPDVHRRVGQALYAALANAGDGDRLLQQAQAAARAAGDGLALNLRFPADAAAWAALPWELLTRPGEENPLLLAAGGPSSCTRYLIGRPDRTVAAPAPAPLAILAVTPAAQIDPAWREEQRAILKAALSAGGRNDDTAGVTLIMPEPPLTMAVLNDLLREHRPQVLSFYGHGALRNGAGHLLLDTAGGGEDYVPPHQFAPLFSAGGLRAALLFACGSGASDGASFRDVAAALSGAGVPAVVAMHRRLRARAATRLQAVLCASLARGLSVQDAVAWGRLALYTEEQDLASWSVPTVTIAQPRPAPIFVAAAPHPAAADLRVDVGGAQVLQAGMRCAARGWQTVAAGAGGAITLGALLAGGLAPLLIGGLSLKTVLGLLGSLGSNALASWIDTWARNAKDRLLKGDRDGVAADLARDLEAALAASPELADGVAGLLERTDGIAGSIQSLGERIDDQGLIVRGAGQQIAAQERLIVALRDDLRRTNLIQGRLHRVVIAQLDRGTAAILAAVEGGTAQLDANDRRTLAAIADLRAEFQASLRQQPSGQPTINAANSAVMTGLTVHGDANQTVNNQTVVSGGINLQGARIGTMGDIVSGDKRANRRDEDEDDRGERPRRRE